MSEYSCSFEAAVIIPARFKSTRFPGKPLAKILGEYMIVRVAKIAEQAVGKRNVYIATDDKRISGIVESEGFSSIMTSSSCKTGTDRVAEAWNILKTEKAYKYILNCQGDEPTLDPAVIIEVLDFMKRNKGYSVNCFSRVSKYDKIDSQNIIKVIVDNNKRLVYASRSVIPGSKDSNLFNKDRSIYKKQVCVYGFTPEDLKFFGPDMKKSNIEKIEDIEILRLVEKGSTVLMKEVFDFEIVAVDTKEDIENVEKILERNISI